MINPSTLSIVNIPRDVPIDRYNLYTKQGPRTIARQQSDFYISGCYTIETYIII